MTKSKAVWQKINMPLRVKLIFWRVMKDNPTQRIREEALTQMIKAGKWNEDDDIYLERTDRDTFKRLRQELVEMPDTEVELLPDDLKSWVAGLPERQHREHLKQHYDELADDAQQLATILESNQLCELNSTILEIAVENDEYDVLKLLNKPILEWLLDHMKADKLPHIEKLDDWNNLRVRDITRQLIYKLYLRARTKEFMGVCEVCKDW